MERTMKVTGKGTISVKPDTTRMMITLNEVFPTYEKTIKESAKKKTELTKALESLGFAGSDLKTLNFSIDPEHESYRDKKDDIWKNRLVGFRYTHEMKIDFPIDNDLLGKVFGALTNCPGKPEFRVQYLVADPEPVKNQLLAKAVADAKEKAAILAKAAGTQLNEIITIDYSWAEIELLSRSYDYGIVGAALESNANYSEYDLDIEADDIHTSDTVTVVWRIS